MVCSVRYIHSKGIIHRGETKKRLENGNILKSLIFHEADLKLENFLFVNRSPDSELKMIGFGLSKRFKFGEVQHEAVDSHNSELDLAFP